MRLLIDLEIDDFFYGNTPQISYEPPSEGDSRLFHLYATWLWVELEITVRKSQWDF